MMFEASKHVPKTEKRCCVFKDNCYICANKTIWQLEKINETTHWTIICLKLIILWVSDPGKNILFSLLVHSYLVFLMG